MLGKACEIQITDLLPGVGTVGRWLKDNPDMIVLDIKVTGTDDYDYFYIIYKEVNTHE